MKDYKLLLQRLFKAESIEERKNCIKILYDSFYPRIYGIAFSVLKNREKSEDVVQSVALKLLSLDKKLFPSKNETTWLYTVVKNEALAYLNRESKTVGLSTIKELSLEKTSIDDFLDVAQFNAIVNSLDCERKEIVTLKIMGGYTHKEIAKMLNKKQSTVQWLYCTAIKSLKALVVSLLSFVIFFGLGFIAPFFTVLFTPNRKTDSPSQDIIHPSTSSTTSSSSMNAKQLLTVSLICLAIAMILGIVLLIILNSEHRKKK